MANPSTTPKGRKADMFEYETDMGNHYSVNLKDERGQTVSTQVVKDINEAKQVKENWENGSYNLLTEIEPKSSMI